MKLGDSIKRLRFTLSKQNKPNQSDIEAFNSICNHLQKSEAEVNQDHLLFGKLYAYILDQHTHHYQSVEYANKKINQILSEPMEFRIDSLTRALKTMETRNFFSAQGIKDPFIKERNPEELEGVAARHCPGMDFVAARENWDTDNVTAHLNYNVNLSIQNFKNHV